MYLIPAIIIIFCLVVILFIIAKKYYSLTLIDVNTISEERQKQIKDKILVDRIRRKTSDELEKIEDKLFPIFKSTKLFFQNIYKKILELEKKYQEKAKRKPLTNDSREKIRILHEIAKDYFEKDDLINAENKYIEIISLDNKNINGYKCLADIYLKKKDFSHAMEILMHSLKINKKDAEVYYKLGNVCKEKNELEEAKKNYMKAISLNSKKISYYLDLYNIYKEMNNFESGANIIMKAIALEPNNPKILDLLLEINIILKDKEGAKEAYEKLKIANPENAKLEEMKRKIDEL